MNEQIAEQLIISGFRMSFLWAIRRRAERTGQVAKKLDDKYSGKGIQ